AMLIPFLDLEAQYNSITDELATAMATAIKRFSFIPGPEGTAFEHASGKMLGIPHVIATGNGTDALSIALRSLAIRRGAEATAPAFSCSPSAETITLCGATPGFADVDPDTYTIDPVQIEAKITVQTKAVIAVHLFGQGADITAIQAICKK